MADPLFGLDEPNPQLVADYLGREAPVSLASKPALPVGGAPAGATGPSGPSGTGGTPTPTSNITLTPTVGPAGETRFPNAGSDALSFLTRGGRALDLSRQLVGGGSPVSVGSSQIQDSPNTILGERSGFTAPSPGFNLGTGAAESGGGTPGADQFTGAGAIGAGGEIGPLGALGAAGTLVGGGMDLYKFLADINSGRYAGAGGSLAGAGIGSFIAPGPGTLVGAALGNLVGNLIGDAFNINEGPSQAWLTFPQRTGEVLQNTEAANQGLASALASATTPEEIQSAIATWKGAIGQRVGGFGEGSGAFDLPGVPGATGTQHEGGAYADFGPEVLGLRSELDAARQGLPASSRLRALSDAIMGGQAAADERRLPLEAREGLRMQEEGAALAAMEPRIDMSGGA